MAMPAAQDLRGPLRSLRAMMRNKAVAQTVMEGRWDVPLGWLGAVQPLRSGVNQIQTSAKVAIPQACSLSIIGLRRLKLSDFMRISIHTTGI